MTRLPGTMYLIDTSAAARMVKHDSVLETIEALIDDGVAATCLTLDLEAGFSARPGDVEHVLVTRAASLVQLPITADVEARARRTMSLLARRGLHRSAGVFDVMTAAVAEHHRAIVLHYDADFEHIASVTGQQQRWVAPRGSVD